MKKFANQILIAFGFIVLFCVFIGCASQPPAEPVIWDENIPKEQTTVISLAGDITVLGYNNNDVRWNRDTNATIPAGDTSLIVTARFYGINKTYTSGLLNITYNFEAGKSYSVKPYFKEDMWLQSKNKFYIQVTDIATKTEDLILVKEGN
jgi:hypothetical protein